MALGDGGIGGGKAAGVDLVEIDQAGRVGDHRLDDLLIGPRGAQFVGVMTVRLDMDAAPAPLVEGPADRIEQRILGADIEIEPGLDLLEGAPQQHILEILRIGCQRRGNGRFRHSVSLR